MIAGVASFSLRPQTCAGLKLLTQTDGVSVINRVTSVLWIPAFAGMTC
jgi:hypothetical protein